MWQSFFGQAIYCPAMIPDCQPKIFFAFVRRLGFPDKFPWFKGY
jgi:hypothetical protein